MAGLNLLYFAWVRDAIGTGEEQLDHPGADMTISGLIDTLSARGGGYAEAFADRTRIRAALDQHFVPLGTLLGDARELALFPPVTGG